MITQAHGLRLEISGGRVNFEVYIVAGTQECQDFSSDPHLS